MATSLATKSGVTIGWSNWLIGAATAGVAVMGVWLTALTVVNGPGVWAAIEQRNAAEIEQEDASFCGKFSMAPGTEAFGACARELAHIRGSQTNRLRRMNFL